MLYPITPIFLSSVLGASMLQIGIIEGIAEGLASLLKSTSGFWSDRIRSRKHFVWIGYLLTAIAKPIIGVSTSWTGVLAARALDRTGKGIRSAPRDALLSEAVSPENLGAAFGWHRAMDTLGAAVGPLIAIYFLGTHTELRPIYYWAFIPGLISVFIALSISDHDPNKSKPQASQKFKFSLSLFSKKFRYYLGAWTLFSITNSSDVFILLKTKASGLDLKATIFLYCFYNLIYALLSPFLGGLSDRIPRKWIMSGGLFIFAITYFGFSFVHGFWSFFLLFGIYGIYMAATDGVGKALAVDLLPKDMKATGLGLLGSFTGIASFAASIIAGGIWDYFGAANSFYYSAAGAILAAIMMIFL